MVERVQVRVRTSSVPFNIDVTHIFSGDTCVIQSDLSCVPNDGSQDIPV